MDALNQTQTDTTSIEQTVPTGTETTTDVTDESQAEIDDFESIFGDTDDMDEVPEVPEAEPKVDDVDEDDEDEDDDESGETNKSGDDADTKSKDTESSIKIKYNGEEKTLTNEEAIEYAQKGMNYDKILTKNEELSKQLQAYDVPADAINALKQLALMNDMPVDEYVGQLSKYQEQALIEREVQTLAKQYPNSDIALLKKTAMENVKKANGEKIANIKSTADSEKEAQQQRSIKMLNDFKVDYPDVDVTKLPQSVIKLLGEGKDLKSAYNDAVVIPKLKAEIDGLKASQKASATNANNKKKSTGKIASDEASGDYTNDEAEFMKYF